MIQAKVIADSKNIYGDRITSMIVTMPRFILAELNTHRMFSRNSASSRAIPFEKMVKAVQENPFVPIAWQKDHKGMQGSDYHTDTKLQEVTWLEGRDYAIKIASNLNNADSNVTKQLCNRLLEPFMWHTVLVTATEWENFFALRCPQYVWNSQEHKHLTFRSKKDVIKELEKSDLKTPATIANSLTDLDWLKMNAGQAEIHMMALAEAMWDAYNESVPIDVQDHLTRWKEYWHIPFITKKDWEYLDINYSNEKHVIQLALKIATARCARVSYTLVGEEGKPVNYENDIKLHDRLAASGHWSPFEHCAKVMDADEYFQDDRGIGLSDKMAGWSGNFRGFIQYRKMFINENIK